MVFIKQECKMNLKTWLIWSLSIGSMIFCFMLLFPAMKDSIKTVSDVYANMGSFSSAFGMDKLNFSTAVGFYGIEAGAVISLGGGMFAALLGIGMLSKEEGGHTTEFLYVMPQKRSYFIRGKLVATIILIVSFELFCTLLAVLSFVAIGEGIEWKALMLYQLGQCLMHLQIALMCFGVSSLLKKNNIGLGIGIASLLYFMNMFANITKEVDFLHFFTPYYYSDAAKVMVDKSIDTWYLGIGMAFAIAGVILAYTVYTRRDLNN